jgi:hypothetical protein
MTVGDLGSIGRYLSISGATGSLVAINGTWRIVSVAGVGTVTISSNAVVAGSATLLWSELYDLTRRTENILRLEDARLLKGIETGVVQDATANHNHGEAYTNVFFPELTSLVAGNIRWTSAAAVDVALSALPDYLNSSEASAFVPTGFAIKGFFLEMLWTVALDSGAAAKTQWEIYVKSSPGTAYNALNSRDVFKHSGYKALNASAGDIYQFTTTAMVPTDTDGRATFDVASSTTVALTSSYVSVRPSAVVCVKT